MEPGHYRPPEQRPYLSLKTTQGRAMLPPLRPRVGLCLPPQIQGRSMTLPSDSGQSCVFSLRPRAEAKLCASS